MRIPLMLALVGAGLFACTPPAQAEGMSFTRQFNGGSVRCSTKTIRSLQPVSWKTPKEGKNGWAAFDVETFEGNRHRYVFTGSLVKVARRPVGRMSRAFPIKAWDFDCIVNADVGVAYTCTPLIGAAGRCTVCTATDCNTLTFRVNRQKA